MKNLEIYLQALQAGIYKEKIITGAIEELKACKIKELSDNRLLVAAVFCQLLQYCQAMYKAHVPENITAELVSTFENIGRIGAEATDDERKDSSLTTVWFLNELKAYGERGDVWNIEDDLLNASVKILLQELDNIYFVFDIMDGDQYVFPIHDLIAKVVGKPEFVDVNKSFGIYQIHILQLAVRLFKYSEDRKKILQTLVKKCNLQFINYLYGSGYIVDTLDLLNYQKNGVMIFYDRNKVLVRHKKREYFEGKPLWEIEGLTVEEERDYQDNKIGFFIQYDLGSGDSMTDFSDVLKNEAGREAFLRLVFDRGIYNVLFKYSIIEKSDGSLLPVNPYCYNDLAIIKGRPEDKGGKVYARENFPDALCRYRSATLMQSRECVMNRVSFGLAVLLLHKENIGVNKLQLDKFSDEDWYQSQMLKNWAKNCEDQIEALTFITEQWAQENDYCARISSQDKQSREKNIEDHEIEELDFYPVKSENGWIYQMLAGDNPKNWYVLCGKTQVDDEDEYFLAVDLVTDVVGKRFSQNTKKKQLSVKTEIFEDPEGLLQNIWGSGEEYYFLYNSENNRGIICDQPLLKALSAVEKIQEKNHFTFETASKITRTQYGEITAMMRLQEAALMEAGKDFFCDFDSQVYYRMLHNLLWSGINKDTISSYMNVFMHHQKLEFTDIRNDKKFMREDRNTLYVPKDGRKSDSVLESIYVYYLKSRSERETNDLYGEMLELRDDGYYYNDNRIENIVFLCDNFECGTGTIRMLKAYLNIDVTDEAEEERRKIDQVRASCQEYYLREDKLDGTSSAYRSKKQVPLEAVIEKNACAIEIHGFYGTENGKKEIETFLQEHHIEPASVTYEKEIVKESSQIYNDVKTVWPRIKIPGNIYTVIREFNMTKRNVFPNVMLNDPTKAVCMFVKKKETLKTV